MLEDLDGFLLVDKPAGIAFSSVVKAVKRKFNLVKVGHGGSLDAMATGLLVLLVNDANKFVGDVMGADRAYEGVMRLGLSTNTHDVHGEPTGGPEREVCLDAAFAERISAAIPEFKGDVFQTESRWCSVRREGSAGYEIADTGEHKPFLAHVYKFDVGRGEDASTHLPFSLTCTKGLIVRTLVNDFGAALSCGAALESLRRVRVGKFRVEDAMPFERLLEMDIKDFSSCVTSLGEGLR